MTKQCALKTIFIIALGGLAFSGYLSYGELFTGGCNLAGIKCGSTFSLFSLPACVYGFIMYLAVTIISALGLGSKK